MSQILRCRGSGLALAEALLLITVETFAREGVASRVTLHAFAVEEIAGQRVAQCTRSLARIHSSAMSCSALGGARANKRNARAFCAASNVDGSNGNPQMAVGVVVVVY